MSTFLAQTLKDASGGNTMTIPDLNQGRAKAWGNMDGSGVPAFRDSFGFSSITDNGVGRYVINLSVARPSTAYAVALTANGSSLTTSGAQSDSAASTLTVSTFAIGMDTLGGAAVDSGLILLSVDGDA